MYYLTKKVSNKIKVYLYWIVNIWPLCNFSPTCMVTKLLNILLTRYITQ